MQSELIRTEHLTVAFQVGHKQLVAVDDMNVSIQTGQVLCLLGETGCGKSVFGNSLLKLLPSNARVNGAIYFRGQDIVPMREKVFRKLRGTGIAAVPQSPATSLNPLKRIGKQVDEMYLLHIKRDRKQARKHTITLLEELGLPRLPQLTDNFPFELSGGMKQRVLVAMGTAASPEFLIVDEPTKGLDWVRKREVIERIGHLQKQHGSAMLLITHDFMVAEALADVIGVMYAGELVEIGSKTEVLQTPRHPFTKGLIDALPQNGFHALKGFSPPLSEIPQGCRLHPRCPYANSQCRQARPSLQGDPKQHKVRCFHADI